eukprot:TRINITY_DN71970_c0_g1_i1.p1 TRINITY_DN71970_c0_g1~~TRINITY_DN71970_c0_g1_i1.p1  ORF type:complete len:588 (+),score=58.90 TRINITY_DN71970_c0_g1_i1:264-1766(+)
MAILFASDRLKNVQHVAKAAVFGSPLAFPYIGDTFKDDKDFVMSAIEAGCDIRHASTALKGDRDVAFAALRKQKDCFQHFSVDLKNDIEIVLNAIRIDPRNILHAAETAKDNFDVMKVVVTTMTSHDLFSCASVRLKQSSEFARYALEACPQTLQHMSDEIRDNDGLVKVAVAQLGDALQHASVRLKDSHDLVLLAVSQSGNAIRHASIRLKDDADVACAAVTQIGGALQHVSQRLRDDADLVGAAVLHDPMSLRFASKRLRGDFDIVRAAVSGKEDAFRHATGQIMRHPQFSELFSALCPFASHSGPLLFSRNASDSGNSSSCKLFLPDGLQVGALAELQEDHSSTYTCRVELRSSSTTRYALGRVASAEPPFTSIDVQWSRLVSRRTWDDYDRKGERDRGDTGWVAQAARSAVGAYKFDLLTMKVTTDVSERDYIRRPPEAQAKLDSIELSTIVFSVRRVHEVDEGGLLSIAVTGLSGDVFEIDVNPDISVAEVAVTI